MASLNLSDFSDLSALRPGSVDGNDSASASRSKHAFCVAGLPLLVRVFNGPLSFVF
jgi:hypothetical protein